MRRRVVFRIACCVFGASGVDIRVFCHYSWPGAVRMGVSLLPSQDWVHFASLFLGCRCLESFIQVGDEVGATCSFARSNRIGLR